MAKANAMLFANVGLPMIVVELPFLVLVLIPVVLVEATVYCRRLSLPWRKSWQGAFDANLKSTFVGIPVAWVTQVFCQMVIGGGSMWGIETPLKCLAAVTLQSAWLIPYEGEAYWMVPAASLFLLVPFLFASIRIERPLLQRVWPEIPADRIAATVVLANLISYSLLATNWVVLLIMALAGWPVF